MDQAKTAVRMPMDRAANAALESRGAKELRWRRRVVLADRMRLVALQAGLTIGCIGAGLTAMLAVGAACGLI